MFLDPNANPHQKASTASSNQPPLRADFKRVLIVLTDMHLGNTIIQISVASEFARYFKGRVDLVVDERYLTLAERVPGIDRVFTYPKQRDSHGKPKAPWGKMVSLFTRLAWQRYQVVIDLTGGIRASAMVLLTGAWRRVGFKKSRRSWVYTHRVSAPHGPHAYERYATLLTTIGINQPPAPVRLAASEQAKQNAKQAITQAWPEMTWQDGKDDENDEDGKGGKEDKDGKARSRPTKPIVVMHPSAGIAWRQWPPARFAEVADALIDQHDAVLAIIGIPGDQHLADELIGNMQHADRARFLTLKLPDLLALFEYASVLVSNESGPTHLAATTDLPIVTIFGPADETKWRPLRQAHLVILRGSACDPGCHKRTCVADRKCLMDLPCQKVAQEALKVFNAHRSTQ